MAILPVLKFLDPQITLKLLEGHEDTITPAAQERERFYKSQSCPRCHGNALEKVGDLRIMFVDGDPLARYLLGCRNCGCEFDPHSGLITKMGNVGKAFIPTIPTIGSKD